MTRRLGWNTLGEDESLPQPAPARDPITILQIGEGNFLRGFLDWMIHTCRKRGLFQGAIAVVQPRPSGKAKIEALKQQDGLYTLVTRGLEAGNLVEEREIISVFADVFDPYEDWNHFIQVGISPELRFVVSNTTEAGLAYQPESIIHPPILSFPGKIAYLLRLRYLEYRGAPEKGLIFLPCELLERNGDALRDAVMRYAEDWSFPEDCKQWILGHNRFLNSLVDRIVPGFPGEEQAAEWWNEWGYRDELLNTAEPYHLWAIEAEEELDHLLPLRQAGLNVHWTADLKPFQQQKVRILNGAHTWMAPLGLLHGVQEVGELLTHPELGMSVREMVQQDILPTLPYSRQQLADYAGAVFERFANPFLHHRLADIAMNSLSKFKVRLLPSLAYYANRQQPIPDRLIQGFAALLRYTQVQQQGDGSFTGTALDGSTFNVRDDAAALDRLSAIWTKAGYGEHSIRNAVVEILADEKLWGQDLHAWPGLADGIGGWLSAWEKGRRVDG